jgi:hypothetical protein
MRKIVVEVDSREKNPILFPEQVIWSARPHHREILQVETIRRELPLGDYRLANHPRCCVIERKASLDEICTNLLSKDRHRFNNAWARFITGCGYPVLAIDGSLANFDQIRRKDGPPPEEAIRAFWDMIYQRTPWIVLWLGNTVSPLTRRKIGAQLVRLMMNCKENS